MVLYQVNFEIYIEGKEDYYDVLNSQIRSINRAKAVMYNNIDETWKIFPFKKMDGFIMAKKIDPETLEEHRIVLYYDYD